MGALFIVPHYSPYRTQAIEDLDGNPEFVGTEEKGDRLGIRVRSTRHEAVCPYCGPPASDVWPRTERRFQNLPLGAKEDGHRAGAA